MQFIQENMALNRVPAECAIFIDGQQITDLYPYVQELSVDMKRGAATVGTIIFDTIRLESGDWIIQDDDRLQPWRTAVITAYFGSRPEEIMRGYIKEVRIEYPPEKGAAKVTMTVQDESMMLDRQQMKEPWSKSNLPLRDGVIATRIADDYHLIPFVDQGLDNTSVNGDDTPIAFLRKRAEANGFELYVREGELHFHKPNLQGQPQPTVLVYAGQATNCLSFTADYDGHKPEAVTIVRAAETGTDKYEKSQKPNLDKLGKKTASSEDKGLSKPFNWYIQQPTGATEEEAASRAQAAINELSWKITAEGELDGAMFGHVLRNYLTVNVDGVGSTYNGIYYVADVRHSFTMDGYRQTFKLLRNATGETSLPGLTDVLARIRS